MISIKDLTYAYPERNKIVFRDFSTEHPLLLLGESGSGKTTLIHLLGGLLRAQRGTVQINDIDMSALSETELDIFRGQHIGFVFQKNHLVSSLSVEKNLLLAPFLANMPIDRKRVHEVSVLLGLTNILDSNIKAISQGQAQRVAIARAILNKPTTILADEPTSALDNKNCDKVIQLLQDVSVQNKATLIVATHDQRLMTSFHNQYVLNA